MNKFYSNVLNPVGFLRKSSECLTVTNIWRKGSKRLMGLTMLFLLSLFGSFNSTAQTVLINPTAEGGFELGPTFADNGWTVSNFTPVLPSVPNPWVIRALSIGAITGNAALISSNGTTGSYSITSGCVNYFYRDIAVPAGQTKIKLDFNWLCGGESTYDLWQVFVAPTTITPIAGTFPGFGSNNVPIGIAGATFVGNGNLQSAAVQNATLFLPPSLAGTTFRLIFVWKNDGSIGVQPPAQIDNISLVSSVPSNYVSIASGDWSAAATWDIGSSPSPSDNALINDGHTVTVNAINQGVNNLSINGTLDYATLPTSFQVVGNLTVGAGGLINVFTGTIGKTLTVAGNIINNGVLNIAVGTTAAGTLTLNGAAVQTVSGSGQFDTDVIRNLIFNNTNTATPNINWLIDNVKVAFNLNITGARINLGTNKLTYGNNAGGNLFSAPVGTGFLPGGKFSRYWNATVTGTAIAAGVSPIGTASNYPFLTASGLNRTMYITRTNATGAVAGELSVVYNDATTVTAELDISDGTYPVTDRYNGNWVVSDEFTNVSASSYRLALYAPSSFEASNGNSRIINATTAIGGLHQNGTAIPVAQRIDVPQADLLAEPLYVGINTDDIPYLSIASGNWNSDSIWNKGIAPFCGDSAAIGAGTTVTVNSTGNSSKSVTIGIGGTLVIASGNLTTGCTLNNNQFINNGTLTVSGGTLNINGNILNNVGSTLNQSGGAMVVNGNDGEVLNSVLTGTPLFRVNASGVANLNLTGGTLQIVNPHRGASTTEASVSISQAVAPNAASTNHTLIFGDGLSDTPGGGVAGFFMNLFVGSQYYSLGNVLVDGGTAANRFLRTSGNIGILGNLTITSGEYQMASAAFVAGNIVNNGTVSAVGLLAMGTFVPPNLISASTVPQSISGTGVFRNSLTLPTANLTTLQVSNTSSSGLTLNVPLTVGTNLTLSSGFVNTTDTNLLTLGTTTTGGVLAGTPNATTFVRGPFARTIASGNATTNYIVYPVGKSAFSPIALAPTTTMVSVMKAEAYDTNAGTAGGGITNLSTNRSWKANLLSGLFTNTRVQLGDATIASLSIPVQAATASGVYTPAFGSTAAFTAGTPNSIQSNTAVNAADFTGFLSFAESNACAGTPEPGNTVASATTFCVGQTINFSLQNATVGSGVTYQWKSSPDGVTYADIVGATAPTYTAVPVASASYKCAVTCATGAATGSSIAVQIDIANTVTSTTPATRCGLGTVVLSGIPNAGATLNWYANATGGTILGSENSFTTPSISATTTYYASAATTTVGETTLGIGATVGTAAGSSFLPGGWGGAKTQYIIRASELAEGGIAPGAITSLGFEATTSGQTHQGFVLQIGATTQNVATATFISGLTQVFRGTGANDAFTAVANTVNTLAFGTGVGSASAFTWDGTSNLVVSISWSSVPGATNATGSGIRVDAAPFTSTNWRQRDNITPAEMQAETVASSGTGPNRPKVIINGVVLCNSPRVAVAATVTPAPAITLSATAATICSNSSSAAITIATGGTDFDTFVWSPTAGVSGDSSLGWNFSPTATTTYALTASQSTGSLCVASAVTVLVTVNPIPSVIIVSPALASVCIDGIQSLTTSGGTIGGSASTTIGTATTLTIQNGLDPTAFNNRYEHYWLQMVFTQAELNAAGVQAGNINGVKFQIATIGSAPNVTDFRVNMGATAVNTLTGFIPTGLTEVYSSPVYTQAIGVNSIVFTTPYVWNGVSNIIVDVRSTGVDLANNSETFFTATLDNKTVSAITSTTFPNSNAFVATNPAGSLSLKRLNTTFDWTSSVPTAITWSPAANLFTDAGATVAYVAGSSADTVYFKSSTAGANNYTLTATSLANCLTTATTAITAVDCGIPYANLQFPGNATIAMCESQTFYARVFKADVTEAPGQSAGITAWIGRNAANTDPATWSEASWQAATFNVQSGNDDEYQVTFGPSTAGTYYVASRFRFAPGTFVYGGYTTTGGGLWDATTNVSATLTAYEVNAPTGTATQDFTTGQTLADFVLVGQNIVWYTAAAGGTVLPASTVLVSGTTYYASQTIATCESEIRLAVTAGTDLRTAGFEIANLRYYPNPVQSVLTVDYSEIIESVQMFNMLGQLVYDRVEDNSKVSIVMTNMAAGSYILKVTVKGTTKNVKVVKE
jgi:hypothetical protein